MTPEEQLSTQDKAAAIVQALYDRHLVIDELTTAQTHAALVQMVLVDRQDQRDRGPLRVAVDLPALDRLAEADDPPALLAVARELGDEACRSALANLMLLHAELNATEAEARHAAQNN